MRPNILYIHSHDTGRYIQPFGHAVSTPNLQSLAEEGVLFRNNHCVCPTCSPSRSALLTGTYPHENGMLGLAHRGFSLNDYSEHILHTLKEAGYRAALSGVQHVASARKAKEQGLQGPWQMIGYDEYLGGSERAHEQAAEWIHESASSTSPFFLTVGFHETHRVFPELHSDDPEDDRYTLPPAPLPDTPEVRRDMASYRKMARELDRRVGVVVNALRERDLLNNTLIISTTDHGIAFPRMKCNLHDSGTGTYLVLRAGPGVADGAFSGGQVVDAMTTHMDLFPTVMEVLGLNAPHRLRGSSLLPLLRRGASRASQLDPTAPDALHKAIYGEVSFHASYEPMRSVRTSRYKYIRRYDGRPQPVLPNVDEGLSKHYLVSEGWRQIAPPEEALYDLVFDPQEGGNLATDPESAEVLDEMRMLLARHLDETKDPIRQGFLLPPGGAEITWADADRPDSALRMTMADRPEQ